MRALLVLVPTLVACTSQNVAPLSEFGPISTSISAELGPLGPEFARDVDPRIFVSFDHDNPNCPVFDDDIDTSIDGVRPDSFEHGYYDDGGGYGHDTSPICQPPYFSIDKVPPAMPRSILRLRDATADLSLEVERLFVNPSMTLATPLVRGELARVDVTDDRPITKADVQWWVGDESLAMGYPLTATITANAISFRMPTDVSGAGHVELRVEIAPPELVCNGFSQCSVQIKGSQAFDATLQ